MTITLDMDQADFDEIINSLRTIAAMNHRMRNLPFRKLERVGLIADVLQAAVEEARNAEAEARFAALPKKVVGIRSEGGGV